MVKGRQETEQKHKGKSQPYNPKIESGRNMPTLPYPHPALALQAIEQKISQESSDIKQIRSASLS